ncbi:hypothetical protein B2M20_09310 [Nitrobacter vulgaris]|uniref:Uncharacterized protein n=1 Tax=Nitrobacter vulgaris TaxID=29421 RepID=A0A1V4HYV2_NITVU|nr:hypothetical protein B2M20_09310 [Nitrobacter vulgaris]
MTHPLQLLLSAFDLNLSGASLLLTKGSYLFYIENHLNGYGTELDFWLLEIFAWLALAVCCGRIVAGLLSPQLIKSFGSIVEGLRKSHRSFRVLVASNVVMGLVGMIGALNASSAYHANLMRALMLAYPRVYICLSAIMFCWASTFFGEGILLLRYVLTKK